MQTPFFLSEICIKSHSYIYFNDKWEGHMKAYNAWIPKCLEGYESETVGSVAITVSKNVSMPFYLFFIFTHFIFF
jgi:hypothetical protein